jgi:hypothetical protein
MFGLTSAVTSRPRANPPPRSRNRRQYVLGRAYGAVVLASVTPGLTPWGNFRRRYAAESAREASVMTQPRGVSQGFKKHRLEQPRIGDRIDSLRKAQFTVIEHPNIACPQLLLAGVALGWLRSGR